MQHGFIVIPLLAAFQLSGRQLAAGDFFTIEDLADRVNKGNLRAVLRILQGLRLVSKAAHGQTDRFTVLPMYEHLKESLPSFQDVQGVLGFPWDAWLREGSVSAKWIIDRILQGWGTSGSAVLASLCDGLFMAPLLIELHRAMVGDRYNVEIRSIEGVHPLAMSEIRLIFEHFGWCDTAALADSRTLQLTPAGRSFVEGALRMCVAVSYRSLVIQADTLLFSDVNRIFGRTDDGHEAHVDRHLNVIGSGAMHSGLFEVHTAMVNRLFDGDDFEKQPAFLVDMVSSGHNTK